MSSPGFDRYCVFILSLSPLLQRRVETIFISKLQPGSMIVQSKQQRICVQFAFLFLISVHTPYLHPILGILEHVYTSLFPATLFRDVHILPPRLQRQAHQDTFNPRARRHQSKGSPSIMHKIELNISASSNLLPFLLRLSVRHILPLVDYRHVLWYESV